LASLLTVDEHKQMLVVELLDFSPDSFTFCRAWKRLIWSRSAYERDETTLLRNSFNLEVLPVDLKGMLRPEAFPKQMLGEQLREFEFGQTTANFFHAWVLISGRRVTFILPNLSS
jgi:hypothetical protein